jgi:hypothetical protein
MGLLRKRTIFHVEESLPDPEEIKLRFRRRSLAVTLFGFLLVLGTPVARDLHHSLHARAEARRFAEHALEARTQAAISRAPVGLEITADGHGWKKTLYPAGEDCKAANPIPATDLPTDGINWKIQAQGEGGQSLSGHSLCWHPRRGLLLDSIPLGEGELLVTLSAQQENAPESGQAFVLMTHGGAELQTISR